MEKQYLYIKAVAEYGSILKASEHLFITTSALSKYVQKTEDALGLKLFDRVGKKFVLTYSGERYLYWQERLCSMQESMEEEMQGLVHMKNGRLRIGVQLSDSKLITRHVLPLFHREYPEMKIELYEDSARIVRGLLEDTVVDIAVLPDYRLNENLTKLPLVPSNQVIVVPKDSPIAKRAVRKEGFPYPWINIQSLRNEKFIVPIPNQNISRSYDEFKLQSGFVLKESVQAKFLESRLICVENGLGITYADDHHIFASYNTDRITLLSYGEHNQVDQKVIAYNKNHFLNEACKRLISLIEIMHRELSPNSIKNGHSTILSSKDSLL